MLLLLLCSLGAVTLSGCNSLFPRQSVTDGLQIQSEAETLSLIAQSIEERENSLFADTQQRERYIALHERYSIIAIHPSSQTANDILRYVVDPDEYEIRRLDLAEGETSDVSIPRELQILMDALDDHRALELSSEKQQK